MVIGARFGPGKCFVFGRQEGHASRHKFCADHLKAQHAIWRSVGRQFSEQDVAVVMAEFCGKCMVFWHLIKSWQKASEEEKADICKMLRRSVMESKRAIGTVGQSSLGGERFATIIGLD